MTMRTLGVALAAFGLTAASAMAQNDCAALPTAAQIKAVLKTVASEDAGGLFGGTRMWGSVVNRKGEVCATAANQDDVTQVWPGSQQIAKAKAYTANAFSLDGLALSTARLYTFTQPGHSLWSLGQSNLWDPQANAEPGDNNGKKGINGGLIFFGGGVPLYKNGKIVGGLGISGDTSCTDHEIAKRARNALSLNPPGGSLVDDITYSNPDGPGPFTHPRCINTYRNGVLIGGEAPASGY